MDVLDDDDDGPDRRGMKEQRAQRVEYPCLNRFRTDGVLGRLLNAEQPKQRDVCIRWEIRRSRPNGAADVLRAVAVLHADVRAHQVGQRLVRREAAEGDAPRLEKRQIRHRVRELDEQSRLADARVADHANHLTTATTRVHREIREQAELVHAADKWLERSHEAGRAHQSRRYRRGNAERRLVLDLERRALQRHVAVDRAACRAADQNRSRFGELLQQIGDAHRVAHRRIIDAAIFHSPGHDDRTRRDPDTQDRPVIVGCPLRDEPRHAALNGERRQNGAPRVVFMHDARAEDRFERIRPHAPNDALVASDFLGRHRDQFSHESVEARGSQPLCQHAGVRDAAGHHRGLLALAVHDDG